MIKAIPFLCALVLLAGCTKGPERVVFIGGTRHMPLRDGRVLHYQEQVGGEQKEYTVSMSYSGGHRAKVYAVKVEGESFGICEYIGKDSSVYLSTTEPLTAMVPRGEAPDWREELLDESAKRGDTWSNEDTGTQTTYLGTEPQDVPAGKFSDCYKTITEALPEYADSLQARRDRGDLTPAQYEQELAKSKLVVVRWFAPGVGLVREQVGSEIIRLLTAVEKEGAGLVDTVETSPVIIDEQ